MENPNPLKYDTPEKCHAIAMKEIGGTPGDPETGERLGFTLGLTEHAAPLEQLIAEKDKTIADLREALEKLKEASRLVAPIPDDKQRHRLLDAYSNAMEVLDRTLPPTLSHEQTTVSHQ